MAQSAFGAEYTNFAPFAGPDAVEAAPTYGDVISLGGLVSAAETPNLSTGQLYSDNKETLRKDSTLSYTIALTTDGMPNKDSATLFGSEYDETSDEVQRDNNDIPPNGGFGYIRNIASEDGEFWKGFFYPKVKAAPTADGANTQGSSTTFGTTSITLTALRAKHPETRLRIESKNFNNEDDAKAWVDGQFTV